jgi:hypothetical protein
VNKTLVQQRKSSLRKDTPTAQLAPAPRALSEANTSASKKADRVASVSTQDFPIKNRVLEQDRASRAALSVSEGSSAPNSTGSFKQQTPSLILICIKNVIN